ncbi:hypothetical protein Cadr_000014220 [Camelus dromedarius]|uniref:Uncharacterized protein n=1 Tax=Camelus dromedarius TaxID=9838 RepID=A0A5N4DDD1_CAMDR|nr:hypothetical protein Cadr_000014220 [Camelus dromedarius]
MFSSSDAEDIDAVKETVFFSGDPGATYVSASALGSSLHGERRPALAEIELGRSAKGHCPLDQQMDPKVSCRSGNPPGAPDLHGAFDREGHHSLHEELFIGCGPTRCFPQKKISGIFALLIYERQRVPSRFSLGPRLKRSSGILEVQGVCDCAILQTDPTPSEKEKLLKVERAKRKPAQAVTKMLEKCK